MAASVVPLILDRDRLNRVLRNLIPGVLLIVLLAPVSLLAKSPECHSLLRQADTILSADVYGYFGDQITEDTSSDAAKRIYEKSADFKSRRSEPRSSLLI